MDYRHVLYRWCLDIISCLSYIQPVLACVSSEGMLLMPLHLKSTAPGQAMDPTFKGQHAKLDGVN